MGWKSMVISESNNTQDTTDREIESRKNAQLSTVTLLKENQDKPTILKVSSGSNKMLSCSYCFYRYVHPHK